MAQCLDQKFRFLKFNSLHLFSNIFKDTLKFVIGELQPQDRLSIVPFDDSVSVLSGLKSMDAAGKQHISAIVASGQGLEV